MLWNKIVDEMVKVEGSLDRLILDIILSFIIIVYPDLQKSFKNLNYIFKSSQTSKRFAVTSYCDIQQKFFFVERLQGNLVYHGCNHGSNVRKQVFLMML